MKFLAIIFVLCGIGLMVVGFILRRRGLDPAKLIGALVVCGGAFLYWLSGRRI